MKKLIFYSIILIIVALVAYFIYTLVGPNPTLRLNVYLFELNERQNPKSIANNIVNSLEIGNGIEVNIINYQNVYNSGQISLTTYSTNSKIKWQDTIEKLISSFLKTSKTNTSNPNFQMESIVDHILMNINNNDYDDYYYLCGAFPNCYKIEDANTCNRKINEILSKDTTWKSIDQTKLKKVSWNFVSNFNEPENKIYEFLLKNNFILNKNVVLSEDRKCILDLTIPIVLFEPITPDLINKITENLKEKFGENFIAKIFSSSNVNGESVEFTKENLSNFKKYVQNVPKTDWNNLENLFVNSISGIEPILLKNKNNKYVVFSGLLPTVGKGKFESVNYDKLQKYKIYWILNNKRNNILTNEFIDGLQKHKSIIIEKQIF